MPCNEYLNCNENARCEHTSKGTFECRCLQGMIDLFVKRLRYYYSWNNMWGNNFLGFYGDGFVCATKTCDILNNCHDNAKCIPDHLTLQYRCVCLNGYIGNGYDCVKDGNDKVLY